MCVCCLLQPSWKPSTYLNLETSSSRLPPPDFLSSYWGSFAISYGARTHHRCCAPTNVQGGVAGVYEVFLAWRDVTLGWGTLTLRWGAGGVIIIIINFFLGAFITIFVYFNSWMRRKKKKKNAQLSAWCILFLHAMTGNFHRNARLSFFFPLTRWDQRAG